MTRAETAGTQRGQEGAGRTARRAQCRGHSSPRRGQGTGRGITADPGRAGRQVGAGHRRRAERARGADTDGQPLVGEDGDPGAASAGGPGGLARGGHHIASTTTAASRSSKT
jgi:hypothetical protein